MNNPTQIRRLGWLSRVYKNLDDSNPSEVGHDGFDEDEIFDDGRKGVGRRRELGGGRWSLLAEYDDVIRRLGWFAR